MKKNLLFALFLMLGFSLSSFLTFDEEFKVDEVCNYEEACTIMYIHGRCSTTLYKTQYCDEGLHGSRREWAEQVQGWDCDKFG